MRTRLILPAQNTTLWTFSRVRVIDDRPACLPPNEPQCCRSGIRRIIGSHCPIPATRIWISREESHGHQLYLHTATVPRSPPNLTESVALCIPSSWSLVFLALSAPRRLYVLYSLGDAPCRSESFFPLFLPFSGGRSCSVWTVSISYGRDWFFPCIYGGKALRFSAFRDKVGVHRLLVC